MKNNEYVNSNIEKSKRITLLICGLVLTRIPEKEYSKFIEWLEQAKRYFDEVIISTWENETNKKIESIVDKVIISKDPGPDSKVKDPISGEYLHFNKSRHFLQVKNGLQASSCEYVVRARIEFYTMKFDFMNPQNKSNMFELFQKKHIDIFCPAAATIAAANNGCTFWLCDTFIIAEKEIMIRVYEIMIKHYRRFAQNWDFLHLAWIEPFGIEQMLGLALFEQNRNVFLKNDELRKLNRINISRRYYYEYKKFVNNHVKLFDQNILGIENGRFLALKGKKIDKWIFSEIKYPNYLFFKFNSFKYLIRKRVSQIYRLKIKNYFNDHF